MWMTNEEHSNSTRLLYNESGMEQDRFNQSYHKPRPGNVDGFMNSRVKHRRTGDAPRISSQPSATPTSSVKAPLRQPAKSLPSATIVGAGTTARPDQQANAPISSKPKTRRLRRHKGKKWSWKRKIVTFVVLIVLIAIGLAGWDVWQLDHKVNHLDVKDLTASVGGAENILVAGSTNRCNLTVQNAQWGFCSQKLSAINSDIIFIVHVVPKTHAVSLLSIPRDTFVPNARSGDEAFKIDAALYQGPAQLVNAVQEDFGIPIQHYVEVGFDGFENIVNAVGGIKMDFPMPVYDAESYLDVKTPGCQLLNGVEALQVVRARHLQYDPPGLHTSDVYYWPQEPESDIARITRTHEFLRVMASTVESKGLGNPITDQRLVDAIAPQLQVDNGLSTSAIFQLADDFHAVNINNVPQYTLPISTTSFGDYIYGGTDYGDVAFPAEANDQQVINQFLGVSNSTDTMTGKSLPALSAVAVNIVNGSGTPDQASQVTTALASLGFNMVGEAGTSTPLSSEAVETVVAYAGSGTEADAEAVARQLSGAVILSQNPSLITEGSQVTVITGTGLAVNSPSTGSSSVPSSGSSGTATTGLEPATSATQSLSAWDPRACTE
jgi:LCP family protein required for cell wall assembly